MAKSQSKNKERVIEVLILLFVVVTVGLLAFQIGSNVMDTLAQSQPDESQLDHAQDQIRAREQQQQRGQQGNQAVATPQPTATLDFDIPLSDSG
jgi:Tfp pilus assembly protein PilV